MSRLWMAFKVALLSALTVPVAVTGTVVTALIFLPLPVNLPAERVTDVSRISRVYDIEGNEIAIFRQFDQNIPVQATDIPLILKQAVISSEDRSFYKHSGVDLGASMRALVADVRGRSLAQGGSTITQQYVKNVYVGNERNIVRKIKEAVLANRVDRKLEKDDILFRYLNTIYFGEGAYGVGAASETYFRKRVNDLTLSEAALLVGVIPAPSLYEPRGNPEGADVRRKLVLAQMLKLGYIDQAQHDDAFNQAVWPVARGKAPGPATLVQPPVKEFRKYPFFVDYVEKYLRARGFDPDRQGLRIQTSLDPKLQTEAETSAAAALTGRGTAPPLEMAIVSVEPPTGFVKSLVGGRDFYNGPAANVNLALGGCPKMPKAGRRIAVRATCWDDPKTAISGGGLGRQTGSSWKPFTLAAAFEKGLLPTKTYPAPGAYKIPGCKPKPGDPCVISNNEGRGGGSQNLRTATAQSTNTVYAQLARDVGLENIGAMAKKLGVASAWFGPDDHGLGYTLGVLDTSPLEMAGAYSVFANRGERLEPTPIVKVLDSAGKTVIDNTKRKGERVIDEVIADNVTDLLRGVIAGGTGGRADIGRPAAGKTGSSQFNANAWFVGFTPTLSTAIWMGKTDGQGPAQKLAGIKGVPIVYGGTIPAATWKAFMTEALKDVPVTDFNEPAPIQSIADALSRKARDGFDRGTRREPAQVGPGGQYEFDLPPPTANAPAPTTTSTTEPKPDDDDGIIFP